MRTITVYCRPLDYPAEFVARAFEYLPALGMPCPGELIARGQTLKAIYEQIEPEIRAAGMVRFRRAADDELSIVETWI
jgi:hypothetical protein